jgi:hypothetical protein
VDEQHRRMPARTHRGEQRAGQCDRPIDETDLFLAIGRHRHRPLYQPQRPTAFAPAESPDQAVPLEPALELRAVLIADQRKAQDTSADLDPLKRDAQRPHGWRAPGGGEGGVAAAEVD